MVVGQQQRILEAMLGGGSAPQQMRSLCAAQAYQLQIMNTPSSVASGDGDSQGMHTVPAITNGGHMPIAITDGGHMPIAITDGDDVTRMLDMLEARKKQRQQESRAMKRPAANEGGEWGGEFKKARATETEDEDAGTMKVGLYKIQGVGAMGRGRVAPPRAT